MSKSQICCSTIDTKNLILKSEANRLRDPRTAQVSPPSSPSGSMSDASSNTNSPTPSHAGASSTASRRVRVPGCVPVSRIPLHIRIQLLKSQIQPMPWQSKQICDHFLAGNCPYIPCRYTHQCLLCMDDLVGACHIAQCKYVHLLPTPDPNCTDNQMIIVKRGVLMPPIASVPPVTALPQHQPRFPYNSAPASAASSPDAGIPAEAADFYHGTTTPPYPRLHMRSSPHTVPSVPTLEASYGSAGHPQYSGYPSSPMSYHSATPYPEYTNAPGMNHEESEYRFGYYVGRHSATPSPSQSSGSSGHQPAPQSPSAPHTSYPVVGCQLSCCAGARRDSYPTVFPPPPPPPLHPMDVAVPATFIPIQSTSAATYQHSPYTFAPPVSYPHAPAAPTHVLSQPSNIQHSQQQPSSPPTHGPACACSACAAQARPGDVVDYPTYSAAPPQPGFLATPTSKSSSTSSNNPWISQRAPPLLSPHAGGSRRTSGSSPTGSSTGSGSRRPSA